MPSMGLTTNGQNCIDATCTDKMTWVDGDNFVYESWMANEFHVQVGWSADCLCHSSTFQLTDNWCVNPHCDAICQKSCVVP